jgi:hypothetical protein
MSSVSSTVIQEIKDICGAGLASMGYFYFDYRDDRKKTLYSLVASLLTQLSAQSNRFCDILSHLYEDHDRGTLQPNDRTLEQSLKEMLAVPDRLPIYLIVDAIDECPHTSGLPTPRERVLHLVEVLVKLCLPNLHICVTSRPEIDIRTDIEPLTSHRVSLHDEIGQKEDIRNFISAVVHSDRNMQRWGSEDQQFVINFLSDGADGM